MTRPEIYGQLYPLAEFVSDEDAGPVMRREAWEHIDFLLDELVVIQREEEANGTPPRHRAVSPQTQV